MAHLLLFNINEYIQTLNTNNFLILLVRYIGLIHSHIGSYSVFTNYINTLK